MNFSIDAVVEVMEVLSKPTRYDPRIMAFQRDGRLYLVDREAVAVIDSGLPCSYKNRMQDHTLDRYIDNPSFSDKSLLSEEGKIIDESEKKYFDALSFSEDGRGIKFKDFFDTWSILNNDFKDDGKIRMIDHNIGYHSHKHGYAMDGVDVWVDDARVMMRNEYFDTIRMNELRRRDRIGQDNRDAPGESSLHGVAILTPYAVLSFPFYANIEFNDSYEKELRMESNLAGDVVKFNKKVWREESPYNFHIHLNPSYIKTSSKEDFSDHYKSLLERINNLKDCYTPKVQAVINEVNSLHNEAYKEDIKGYKKIRKKNG